MLIKNNRLTIEAGLAALTKVIVQYIQIANTVCYLIGLVVWGVVYQVLDILKKIT